MIEAVQAWVGSLVCFFSGVCFKDLSITNVQIDPVNALIGLAIGAITLRFLWKQNAINEELKSIEARRAWLDYIDRKPRLTRDQNADNQLRYLNQGRTNLLVADAVVISNESQRMEISKGLTLLTGDKSYLVGKLLSPDDTMTLPAWMDYGSIVLLIKDLDTGYFYVFGDDFLATYSKIKGIEVTPGFHPLGFLRSHMALSKLEVKGVLLEDFERLSADISSPNQVTKTTDPRKLFSDFCTIYASL